MVDSKLKGIVLAAPSTPAAVQVQAKSIAETHHKASFILSVDAYQVAIPYCNGWDGWIEWCLKRYEIFACAELFLGKINQEIVRKALLIGRRVTFETMPVIGVQTIDSHNWKRGWRLLLEEEESQSDYEELL